MKTTLIALLCVLGAIFPAMARESILSFTVEPAELALIPGRSAVIRLVAMNNSPHQADDLEVIIIAPDGLTVIPNLVAIEKIAPFARAVLTFTVTAADGFEEPGRNIIFELVYTYCRGDFCFQIVDELSFLVTYGVGDEITYVRAGRRGWLLMLIAGIALSGTILLMWRGGPTLPLYIILLLIIGGMLVHGLRTDQHNAARRIAVILCTACIGIDDIMALPQQLYPETIAAIEAIERRIELLVFHTEWCRSCPYAIAMVNLFTVTNPLLIVTIIDADQEPEMAEKHGIKQNRRMIVPAIVRYDTGKVIFGINDLENRLSALVREEK